MSNPICVATGDVHFSVGTLELATAAVRQARRLACDLGVPLLLNGDTLDGKAIVRGECANRLIEILIDPTDKPQRVLINTGNHDLISEKGKAHVLHFLKPYAQIIDVPTFDAELDSWIVPYFNDGAALEAFLASVPKGARLFVHQGVMSAKMGAYVQDRSSLPKEAFANFRVIASHYHGAQSIKCGRPRKGMVGLFSYLGSPYSVTAAEALDGPKGINMVFDDGSIELMPTNLRKHVLAERSVHNAAQPIEGLAPCDLLHLKVTGAFSELEKLDKRAIGQALLGHNHYKLTKTATEAEDLSEQAIDVPPMEVLDKVIDLSAEPADQKLQLKALAREILQ